MARTTLPCRATRSTPHKYGNLTAVTVLRNELADKLFATTTCDRRMDNSLDITDEYLQHVSIHMPTCGRRAWEDTPESLDLHLAALAARDTVIFGRDWNTDADGTETSGEQTARQTSAGVLAEESLQSHRRPETYLGTMARGHTQQSTSRLPSGASAQHRPTNALLMYTNDTGKLTDHTAIDTILCIDRMTWNGGGEDLGL